MCQQPKVKIFLADKRGCDESGWFRSYNTFNFRKYFNEYKHPFGDLYVLNDDTIAGRHSINLIAEENSYILLLPVVGTVLCKVNQCIESIISPGQSGVFRVRKGDSIELLNCYENELINFIQVWIKVDLMENYGNQLFTFNLDENKNRLIEIAGSVAAEPCNPVVSMGKFVGRQEAAYKLQNKQNNLFVFVIEGVFEVQGRLLQARDGLGLWNEPGEIELEALSNNAIVLIIEMNKYKYNCKR